jgi:hypothetical protein
MGTKSCCRKRVSLWRRARRTPRNGYEPPKLQLQLLASRQATAHGGLCVAYAQRVLRELETRQQFLRGVIFKLWHTPGYVDLYGKVYFYIIHAGTFFLG